MNDIRYQSSPWISINQNKQNSSTQNKIYLPFKQGIRPDLDIKGHYNPIIPKTRVNQQIKEKIYNDLNQLNAEAILQQYNKVSKQNKEKMEQLNILVWNAKSIGNFTKKKYFTQTLYKRHTYCSYTRNHAQRWRQMIH